MRTATSAVLSQLFAPGFFSSGPVRSALLVGTLVAVVSSLVGTFTVLRRHSFAGHSLAELGSTGGSAATLFSANPLWGFFGIGVVSAALMEALAGQRSRSRDLATGLVLGAGLGLAALFLYLDSTSTTTTGTSVTILFGSLFAVSSSIVVPALIMAAVVVVLVAGCYRMLLLVSLDPDLARARSIPVRAVAVAYMLSLATAVSLAAATIGAVLSTALLVGPSATAVRICRRPGRALLVSAAIGVASVWLGILLAYDSYRWPPTHRGWPVSFFVVALVFSAYAVVELATGRQHRAGQSGDRTRA